MDVRRKGFSTVIYPSHTRQYWLESVVRVSGARQRITASPVGRYMEDWELRLSSTWYNSIIETGDEPIFEFFRNRNFFSALSQKASKLNSMQDFAFEGVQKTRMILIAPGASTSERKWPSSAFSKLLHELSIIAPGFAFGLVGSKQERPDCEDIIRQSGVQAHNFAGECSLPESLRLIAAASLLIANESGPVHMAATTGTACVCISNGNHFARWNPYPKALAGNIITCYPAYFGDPEANRETLTKHYHDGSRIPASDVSFDAVFQAAERLVRNSISDFGQNH
jgi:ADP-heptose:LPS heptosyltransferase